MIVKFSDEWFREYCKSINSDEKYRNNGKGWKWSVTFSIAGDQGSRYLKQGLNKIVKMKLKEGRCEGIEFLSSESIPLDEYLLKGKASVWESIIDGKTSIINAMLKGDLKVTGDVRTLTKYIPAANDLARIASGVK